MQTETVPKFLRVLNGERTAKPPVWFMRQAGRYLPEYRALRAQAPDFIAFCLNPTMAAEATLQPMRRFPFDASIVFADILLLPQALGQKVWFEAGEGPKLGPLPQIAAMRDKTSQAGAYLRNVGETLGLVRAGLPADKALIGFAGAPWTVATYMIEGGSSDRTGARTYAYTNPEALSDLLDVLVEATVDYLAMQVGAGAQALMLFESWADGLTDSLFETLVIGPHRKIIEGLRGRGIDTPVIGFPRGAPALAERYAVKTPVQAIGLDTTAPLALGQRVQALKPIQGALDPLLLRAGGAALDARVEEYLQSWGAGPFIFNLGHGILPDTPIAHVERVLELVTGEKSKAAVSRKIAVVLLNLGGPDTQAAVRPFLFNLFADKAIIRLPWPARMALAALISITRAKSARSNYALMGGGSPLLPETRKQADALQSRLDADLPGDEVRTFIAMRYWKPFTDDAAREVAQFAPDEVILLPLYPQFSTTTTGSSIKAWRAAYRGSGVVRTVCCYPDVTTLAKAHALLIRQTWERAGRPEGLRLLFSAHGLPQQVVDDGDPYAMQVEKTCAAVLEQLGPDGLGQGWDWRLAYQSRVGRLKWLGPYTPQAIAEAGEDGRGLIVVPIAFVSEHVETLVELDIEYGELAGHAGVEPYLRVPALGVQPDFIDTLAGATRQALNRAGTAPAGSPCGGDWRRCALKQGQAA